MSNGDADRPGQSGSDGIDPTLRDRLMRQVATFDSAFEKAQNDPSAESLEELRQAVDQLMRAAARILIEIDRA
jgi:hypothetical protein